MLSTMASEVCRYCGAKSSPPGSHVLCSGRDSYNRGVAAERERVLLELTAMVRDLGWLPSDVARLRARIMEATDA